MCKEVIDGDDDDDELMSLTGGENASFGESNDAFCKSTITRADVLNLIVGIYLLLSAAAYGFASTEPMVHALIFIFFEEVFQSEKRA